MNKKILFFHIGLNTFVKRDIAILSEKYTVDVYEFKLSKKLLTFILEVIRQFFFLVFKGRKYDVLFIWFSDYHSFLPSLYAKLFYKKCYIVAGGFDATAIPELGYGLFCKKNLRSVLGRKSYEYCTKILPVDESLIINKNSYAFQYEFDAGIMHYCNVAEDKFLTIPTGYDVNFWKPVKGIDRQNSVVSVASVASYPRWKLKGGDLLMEVAKRLPQYEFYFYGISEKFQQELIERGVPENFHLKGFVQNESLPEIYSKHKVYAQLSLSEGLPNVLCEAMLCGCVPLGSNVNGIPKAIGSTGFILERKNVQEAVVLVAKAIEHKETTFSQERILNLFDINKRIQSLIGVI
ncbi:glycosyltransferase family 4 protein [uncultured Sunxiuqinia sp.]|uniref:glycosyltransferase family 4 protein n=1 Tax=uncultured Sunxiuqinia sp. TaxID=1573825 RepID=UPI002AA669E0|nr:glycosyltransferase family 4 protein [uncultured Sunxiuqinia sp.]